MTHVYINIYSFVFAVLETPAFEGRTSDEDPEDDETDTSDYTKLVKLYACAGGVDGNCDIDNLPAGGQGLGCHYNFCDYGIYNIRKGLACNYNVYRIMGAALALAEKPIPLGRLNRSGGLI